MYSTFALVNVFFRYGLRLSKRTKRSGPCCWIWRRKPDDTGTDTDQPNASQTCTQRQTQIASHLGIFGESYVCLGKINIRQLLGCMKLHTKDFGV